MDLEYSSFGQSINRLYRDLFILFGSISTYIECNNTIFTLTKKVSSWLERYDTKYISNILSLLPLIDNLEILN